MLLTVLSMATAMFIAELGDKTQLFVMGLAAKEKICDVFAGIAVATIALNAMGVYLGATLAGFVRIEMINLCAGFFFLIFAYLSIRENCDLAENRKISGVAVISIAAMFFVAELGGKTQLLAIAFAAENPGMKLWVFIGATAGMLLADTVGLILGRLLNKKIPRRFFSWLAFFVFAFLGMNSIRKSAVELAPQSSGHILMFVVALYAVVVIASLVKEKHRCSA